MRKSKIIRRRALALLLTLVMCLGMLPGTAWAANWESDDQITITIRVFDSKTGSVYHVGTDYAKKGNNYIQSDTYKIPQLSKFTNNSYGRVEKVVGNWYFPAGDSQPGAGVNWSCNVDNVTMTYWVNGYNPAGGSTTTPDPDGTSGTGSQTFYAQVVYVDSNKTSFTYGERKEIKANVNYDYGYTLPRRNFWPETLGINAPAGYKLAGWQSSAYVSSNDFKLNGTWWTADHSSNTTDLYSTRQYQTTVVLGTGYSNYKTVFLIYQNTGSGEGGEKQDPVTLTYMDGTSIYATVNYLKGDTAIPIDNTTTKAGYVFEGWDTNSSAKTTVYKPGVSTPPLIMDVDKVLYAVWKQLDTDKTLTSIAKVRVKESAAVPSDIDTTGITFGDPITVDPGATVTLLYKITVTGEEGANYTVSDTEPGVVLVDGCSFTGTIDASGSADIYVTKLFTNVTSGTSFTNTATLKPGQGTKLPNGEPSISAASTPEPPTISQPALTITKTVDKTTAEVNDELTYTITVTNPGSQPVTGVTVTDVLPDGTDFVSAGQRGSYVSDDRTVTWSNQTVPPMTAGQDGKLELTLKIKVTKEGAVSNTATLTVPDKAPVTSDPAETTVGPKSDPQIKVTKQMGNPVVDEEAGTATVDYTVTVRNTGNKTLYGLRIDDTLTTTVKSGSAKMTIIPVSGYIGDEAESTVTLNGGTERSWTLLDRNTAFSQGQEKVLKYQLILENTGDDELSVDLENTAVGGSWRAPKTAPQGVRTLALDGDAPDVTDDSTASGNLGSSSGNVTIPPKPSGDACGHPHDGDGNCTEPGCTHTEEGKDCCPKPEEPEPPETFTVTWIDRLTDEIIGTQTVTSLAEAVYPEHPAHKGYQGSGWSQPVPDGDGSYTIYAEYVELQVDPEAPSYAYLRDELGIMVRVECDADTTHEPLDYEVPLKADSYSADVRGSRCVITIAPDLYVADCDGAHSIDGISPQTIELLYEEDEVIETPDQDDPDVPAGAPSDEDPAPSDEDPAPSDEDPAPSDEDPAPSGEDMEASGEPAAPVQFSALSLADGPAGSWRLADGEPGTVTFSVHCEEPEEPDVPDVPETLEVTVVWLDGEDGNTLKTAKVEVPADDPTSIPGRLYPRNPIRDGYRFTGWGDPVERDGVVTIVAQWEKLPDEERTLTVTWLDWDGALLAREDWDPDDPEPRYPGRTPVRPDSSRYTYTFSGWDRQVDGEGNVTYTAVYTRDRIYDDDDGDNNYGGGGNGGSALTPPASAIPDPDVPQGGDTTTILDERTPLAGAIGLNNTEHFAYMIGYENGTVRPLGQITRAEVATIFFRLMDDSFRSQYWSTASGFSDVAAGKWFNNAVSTGVNAGKLTGYPDGTFRPNQSITRAEFAAIAVRFLSDEVQGVSGGSFSDTAGHWAADAIGRAAAAGWITGYPDGAFRPNQSITRAEAATIINNMLGRSPDKDHLLAGMTTWPDNPEGAWYYEAIQEATNSHDYDRDELGVTEIWRAIQTVRDWKALEEQWAA